MICPASDNVIGMAAKKAPAKKTAAKKSPGRPRKAAAKKAVAKKSPGRPRKAAAKKAVAKKSPGRPRKAAAKKAVAKKSPGRPRKAVSGMSAAHKAALAEGRRETTAIKSYLEAIQSGAAGDGTRRPSAATLEKRLAGIQANIKREGNLIKRVELQQQRLDVQAALKKASAAPDVDALEAGFVKYAAKYSARKQLSKKAWRASGVPASVVKAAGIS